MARRKTDKTDLTPPATPATSATRAGNEWGVPDWRDASAYDAASNNFPDVAEYFPEEHWRRMDRWRWEFLRRRDDYRADYTDGYQSKVASGMIDPDAYRGDFYHENAEKYGLESCFYNPSISDWGLFAPSWYDPEMILSDPPDAGDRWWQIKTLTFDLGKPIAPQLEAAKAYLLHEQGIANLTPEEQMTLAYGPEHSGGRDISVDEFVKLLDYKPRAVKPAPKRWALYLRVLDAREDGASLSQIASFLPPHIARRDPKAAHNVYEQARAVQFRF